MDMTANVINQQELIPNDLATWPQPRSLVLLALEGAHEVGWERGPVRSAVSGTSLHVLRTLLIYAYARGFWSSAELEDLCVHEPGCRYICAGARPTGEEIRVFRRKNIGAIEEALGLVVGRVMSGGELLGGGLEGASRVWIELEARRRIHLALHCDSMALDE
jgi:hypothetical protein